MLEEEVFPFRIFCIFHNFTSNFSLYHMNNCSIIFFLLNVRTGEASSPFININVHLHPKSIQTIMIVINFTMIYLMTKVSSAILLANVGLLLGGFALTNIDKVMMIKKKENDANDDDYETLTLSQVKQLADIADSWLGGGGQVEGDGGGGDRLGDVVTKVVASSGFLSTIFQLGSAI